MPLPAAVEKFVGKLPADDRAALVTLLEAEVTRTRDDIADFAKTTTETVEAEFGDQWLPKAVVAHLAPSSTDDLLAQLRDLDLRWRLDALLVVKQLAESS